MLRKMTRRGFLGTTILAASFPFLASRFGERLLPEGTTLLVNGAGLPAGAVHRIGLLGRSGHYDLNFVDADTGKVRSAHRLQFTGHGPLVLAEFGEPLPPGRWCLVSGPVSSPVFEVSEAPWLGIETSLLQAIRRQRCGIGYEEPERGIKRPACHTQDARAAATGEVLDLTGGWHDAGDFGKYVATTSVVVGELLSLHLEGKAPGGTLEEARHGLEWLLRMQRADGAFYRKLAGRTWPPDAIFADEDTQPRLAYGVSSADTARGGAALAIGARAFDTEEPGFAKKMLQASRHAFAWLGNNPDGVLERTLVDDEGSGAYRLEGEGKRGADFEARLWLALELYLAGGDPAAEKEIRGVAKKVYVHPVSWAQPHTIGLLNFLKNKGRSDIANLRHEIRKGLLDLAMDYVSEAGKAPDGIALTGFDWGSNREVGARGRLLAEAHAQSGKSAFGALAIGHIDYLLGVNREGRSFVTGTGERAVRNPHHRPDEARRKTGATDPLPGMLVGGPNDSESPRYADSSDSFATNEFAIDYNAALLSLLGRSSGLASHEAPGLWHRLLRFLGFN